MNQDKNYYLDNVSILEPEVLSAAILNDIVQFDELRETGEFIYAKQEEVRVLIEESDVENRDYKNIDRENTESINAFIQKYPNTFYKEELENLLAEIEREKKELKKQEEERKKKEEEEEEIKRKENEDSFYREIKENPNLFSVDEVISGLDDQSLRRLCNELGYDYNFLKNYEEVQLRHGPIPSEATDIPSNFSDIYFWGIPSSGKTCALASIFYTMNKDYTITDPSIQKKYGTTYRDSLINIFNDNKGYLPPANALDATQYMPFLLRSRKEKDYRNASFFELSGEVFRYFYELATDTEILSNAIREDVEKAFETLKLLLNSKNKKIHFFFIDYNRLNTLDNYNLKQVDYLNKAAVYFRDNNKIFSKHTDAIYIIVTKADLIEGENKAETAKLFLQNRFGSFYDEIEGISKKYSIPLNVKLFSIGEVQLQRIGVLDTKYSEDIVKDLMKRIKPNKKRFWDFLRN